MTGDRQVLPKLHFHVAGANGNSQQCLGKLTISKRGEYCFGGRLLFERLIWGGSLGYRGFDPQPDVMSGGYSFHHRSLIFKRRCSNASMPWAATFAFVG